MTAEQIRARLLDERRRTVTRLAGLAHDFDSIVEAGQGRNSDDEHDPEGTTIAYERSLADSLTRRARGHLGEIDAALARVEDGTYGSCEACGQAIPEARLAARPTARTCVECARAR